VRFAAGVRGDRAGLHHAGLHHDGLQHAGLANGARLHAGLRDELLAFALRVLVAEKR
jgi:hypothetical protein